MRIPIPSTARQMKALRRIALVAGTLVTLVAISTASFAQQQLPATIFAVRDVPLPGDTSRFDYESLDPSTHRLYISHLGAGTVPVYDITSGTIVGEVQDVP